MYLKETIVVSLNNEEPNIDKPFKSNYCSKQNFIEALD